MKARISIRTARWLVRLALIVSASSLAADTPVNIGTYTCDTAEEEMFKGVTKRAEDRPTRTKTGQEILNALRTEQGSCIRTWMHAQHAWASASSYGAKVDGGLGGGEAGSGTGFYGKDPAPQPATGGRAAGGRNLNDLQAAITAGTIKFCRPCRIYIYGCRVSNIGNFAARLSTITGCTVYAAVGACSTARPNGNAGRSTDTWRAEEGWDTYSGGQKTTLGEKYIDPKNNW